MLIISVAHPRLWETEESQNQLLLERKMRTGGSATFRYRKFSVLRSATFGHSVLV